MSQTLYIDGEWVSAEKEQIRSIINPFNQEEIAIVSEGGREDAIKAPQPREEHLTKENGHLYPGLNAGRMF